MSAVLLAATAAGQSATPPASDAEIRAAVEQLRYELQQTRTELGRAQGQIESLRNEVHSLRHQLSGPAGDGGGADAYLSAADVARQRPEQVDAASLDDLKENQQLLRAQVDEQYQTKVESASKYRVKLSGLVLMNAFSTRGSVDVVDLPNRALNPAVDNGSGGFTLRQTLLGLQVFGPRVAGARSSANISVDFFGGFPRRSYGTTAGILRLREATGRLDWRDTSLVFGQEMPFMSPLSPTSYATLAEPAFSWAGNLWVWTPQVAVEHRFHRSDTTYFSLTGGVLAPLTEDIADYAQAVRPGPGERSRRPALGAHAAWHSQLFGRSATFGLGGYASHLSYTFNREIESWAATADWQVPIGRLFEFKGEAYRGRAVGGLGGGIWQTLIYDGNPDVAQTHFRPLNAAGGWSQLKFRPHAKWEFNGAAGQDNVLAHDLRWTPYPRGEYMTPLARNRAAFGNVIFRPRSNLLFSVEYRKLWTYDYLGTRNTADQVNIAAGVSF